MIKLNVLGVLLGSGYPSHSTMEMGSLGAHSRRPRTCRKAGMAKTLGDVDQ